MKKEYEIFVKIENNGPVHMDSLSMPYIYEAHGKKRPENPFTSEAAAEEWIIKNGDYKYAYVILPVYRLS